MSERACARADRPGLVALAALAGVALGVALVSCGGGQTTVVAYERIDERKQEIHMLWAQIRAWRQDAGLKGVEPPRGEIMKTRGTSIDAAKNVCPTDVEPVTTQCKDVCSLAEAICENAESICRIADELAGDAWAKDKCSSAKASCKEAKQECCRCNASETHE